MSDLNRVRWGHDMLWPVGDASKISYSQAEREEMLRNLLELGIKLNDGLLGRIERLTTALRPYARCQQQSYVGRLYSDQDCGTCEGCKAIALLAELEGSRP